MKERSPACRLYSICAAHIDLGKLFVKSWGHRQGKDKDKDATDADGHDAAADDAEGKSA